MNGLWEYLAYGGIAMGVVIILMAFAGMVKTMWRMWRDIP